VKTQYTALYNIVMVKNTERRRFRGLKISFLLDEKNNKYLRTVNEKWIKKKRMIRLMKFDKNDTYYAYKKKL